MSARDDMASATAANLFPRGGYRPMAERPTDAPGAPGENRMRPGWRVIQGEHGSGEPARGGVGSASLSEPQVSDTELVRAFIRGDETAFAELVRRHERVVLGLLRRYAPDPDDARDLAQRAFLKAFAAVRRPRWLAGRAARAPFRAWLYRVAVNLGRNHARDRRRWRRAPPEEAERLPVAPRGTAGLERAEQVAALRAAVLELPRRQREVLTLRVDGELAFKEVGLALGISENDAKVNFHHAARRLRALVALRDEGDES